MGVSALDVAALTDGMICLGYAFVIESVTIVVAMELEL